jgi:fucose 4-O-acetylase-like acetyltransferase|tara:strand:+ start:1212 stop:1322 length:111 start_codon:yes stop_codon:yes gene_type:complete
MLNQKTIWIDNLKAIDILSLILGHIQPPYTGVLKYV